MVFPVSASRIAADGFQPRGNTAGGASGDETNAGLPFPIAISLPSGEQAMAPTASSVGK